MNVTIRESTFDDSKILLSSFMSRLGFRKTGYRKRHYVYTNANNQEILVKFRRMCRMNSHLSLDGFKVMGPDNRVKYDDWQFQCPHFNIVDLVKPQDIVVNPDETVSNCCMLPMTIGRLSDEETLQSLLERVNNGSVDQDFKKTVKVLGLMYKHSPVKLVNKAIELFPELVPSLTGACDWCYELGHNEELQERIVGEF